jgi:hypothetical protein
MVMDRINSFSSLSRELVNRFKGADPGESLNAVPTETAPGQSGERPARTDRVDISPKAHRLIALHNAMEAGRRALESVPEVRQDRVAEARARLDRGFYNSVEVRNRVAERLNDVAQKMEEI